MISYKGFMDIDTYPGEFSGEAYPFGLLRRRGYVDRRDVPGLVKIVEDTQLVFEVP